MKFYQYWIIIITVILVLVTVYNIAKMVILISQNKTDKISPSTELNKNIRNLLISMALLSLVSLVYIILIFKQVG